MRKVYSDIIQYFTKYGIEKCPISLPPPLGEPIMREFYAACHEGYKIGQEICLSHILELEEYGKQIDRMKPPEKLIASSETLEYHIYVLKKLMDTVVWLIMGDDYFSIRRLYLGKQHGYLTDKNFISVWEEVQAINSEPMSFAVMNDLTSFVGVGDITAISIKDNFEKEVRFIEVKEGQVNEEISSHLKFPSIWMCERAQYYFHQQYGKKKFKQLQRMKKQIHKNLLVQEAIRSEGGVDPVTGLQFKVTKTEVGYKRYYSDILDLHAKLNEGLVHSIIDDCILCFMVKEPLSDHYACIEEIVSKWAGKNVLRFDFTSSFKTPLSRPVLLCPFPVDLILDLILGQIKLLFCFDVDRFIRRMLSDGVKVRWSTKEVSSKESQLPKERRAFSIGGRHLIVDTAHGDIRLSDGILVKMLCDFVHPQTISDHLRILTVAN